MSVAKSSAKGEKKESIMGKEEVEVIDSAGDETGFDWRERMVQAEKMCFREVHIHSFAELEDLTAHLNADLLFQFLKDLGVSPRTRISLLYALKGDLSGEDVSKVRAEPERGPLEPVATPVTRAKRRSSLEAVAKRTKAPRYGGFWIFEIPFINVVYDFLFSGRPQFEVVKAAVNDMLLLSTLNLLIIASYINSVTYTELELALERAEQPATYFGCRNRGRLSIKSLTKDAVNGFAFTSACLLNVLAFHLFSLNTKFGNSHALRVWWRYSRMQLLLAGCLLVLGYVFNFRAFISIFQIKFPDFWIADHADKCPNGNDWPMEPKSAWGYSMKFLSSIIYPNVVIGVIVLSLATRGKFRAERGLTDCYSWCPIGNKLPKGSMPITPDDGY